MKRTFRKATMTNPAPRVSKWERSLQKLKIVALTITFFVSLVAVFIWWHWDEPLVSPVSSFTTFRFFQNHQAAPLAKGKIVYGFLPYWNLKKTVIQPEMTHLSYFSLTIGGDGSLLTTVDNEPDQGYQRLGSDEFFDLAREAINHEAKIEIVISQFNEEDISSFLQSKTAQEKFLLALDNVLLAYPISGVNIDIECSGSTCNSLQPQMTAFMAALHQHIQAKYTGIAISIDIYASAAKKTNIWDVATLEPYVDYVVVMAYDFHRKSSQQAGPVAPLFGGKEYWDSDISSHLQELLTIVPNDKILLGIPFYGYRWQTVSRDPQSHTFPDTGSTAIIDDIVSLLQEKEVYAVEEHWNENALSPYISYEKDGEIYVIYYENSRSLSYKLDFVNQLDLAGVAIWAIGYEGNSRELWEVINQKLYPPTTN